MPRFFSKKVVASASLMLLVAGSGCSLDGLDQNILLETVGDSSGGSAGTACGEDIFPPPIAIPDDTANAASTLVSVLNFATDHPLLTANGDGYHDTTVFNADVVIQNPGIAGRQYTLDWKVKIKAVDSCTEITTIANSTPFTFPTTAQTFAEDFESLVPGTIVTNQLPGFTVECDSRKRWRPDACIILDSQSNKCANDFRSTTQGHVLVLAKNLRDRNQDGIVDRPDDASRGGTMNLNFDTPVSLTALSFRDIDWNENSNAIVRRADGTSTTYDLPRGANAAATTLSLTESNVVSVEIILRGSAALTDVVFTKDSEASGAAELNLRDAWDGIADSGLLSADGNYSFKLEATLRDLVLGPIDQVESKALGMTLKSNTVDFDQQPAIEVCDPETDNCGCDEGEPGCSFIYTDAAATAADLLLLGPSFISTTQDANTGRITVVADVRALAGSGLIFKGDGIWNSASDVQTYISTLTGVPADLDGRLFNFDYTQIGSTTGVTDAGTSNYQFNNLLLDAITNENGAIVIDGTQVSVADLLNSTGSGAFEYDVADTYAGASCSYVSAFNGSDELGSKFCVYNDAIGLPEGLGIYTQRSGVFDTTQNGVETIRRSTFCDSDGCAIRTQTDDVTITVDSFYFSIGALGVELVFNDQTSYSAASLTRTFDRGPVTAVISGQCSRAVVENADLRVRLDAADGAVGTTCIINGYYD